MGRCCFECEPLSQNSDVAPAIVLVLDPAGEIGFLKPLQTGLFLI